MEATEEQRYYEMPRELIIQLLIHSPYLTVKNLCQNSKAIAKVCEEETLWGLKINQDFPLMGEGEYNRRETYKEEAEALLKGIFDWHSPPPVLPNSWVVSLIRSEAPFDFKVTNFGNYRIVPDIYLALTDDVESVFSFVLGGKPPGQVNFVLVVHNRGDKRDIEELIKTGQFSYLSLEAARQYQDDLLTKGYYPAGRHRFEDWAITFLRKEGLANVI